MDSAMTVYYLAQRTFSITVNNLERHGFMRTDLVTVILLPYLDAVTML
jgi:hypothetical protein